jgi:hypothetical protein
MRRPAWRAVLVTVLALASVALFAREVIPALGDADPRSFARDVGSELARVPTWAWWLIINLAIGCWVALAHVDELEHPRRAIALTVRGAGVVLFGVVGFLIFGVLWLVERLEKAAMRARREADGDRPRRSRAAP